jgi:hypothetical protein
MDSEVVEYALSAARFRPRWSLNTRPAFPTSSSSPAKLPEFYAPAAAASQCLPCGKTRSATQTVL